MGYLKIPNLYKATDILLFKEVFCLEKIHGCVQADTPITMSDGTQKPIKMVVEGDKIQSYNIETNQFEEDEVEAMFVRPSNEHLSWYKIEFSDGKMLICTGDHPILTEDGWVKAENLIKNHKIS